MSRESALDRVRWIDLHTVEDERGSLTVVEGGRTTPFDIRRVFYIYDVSNSRGGHAHPESDQLLIAVAGSFRAELFDGRRSASFRVDDPRRGLFLPRMVYIDMDEFEPGTVLLVLTNTHFDACRPIRTREALLAALDGDQG